jgi:RNA polymerase sigma-70 factor (ECF subfamily)
MAKSLEVGGPAQGRDGFAHIVQEHQAMVFSLAYHFLQNRAAAEDLTQEVFVGLFENLHAIQSPAHLKAWLRQVTSRRCIDIARKARIRRWLNLGDAPEPAQEIRLADPLIRRRLQTLIATLPAKQRIAVVLRYQEDLEPSEIATVLDIPLNSVKSLLRRSLDVLRTKLTRQFPEVSK